MFRRVAGVAAASLLVSGLSATSAFAAAGTTVPGAQVTAALQASLTATTVAAKAGYAATDTVRSSTFSGTVSGSMDRVHHRVTATFQGLHLVAAAGAGEWSELSAKERAALRGELELLGRPGATYQLTPMPKLSAADIETNYLSDPVADLTDTLSAPIDTATASTDATGATTYVFTVGPAGSGLTETAVIGADNVLRSFQASAAGNSVSSSYRYGPQTVNLPAATVTVTDAQVAAAHAAVVQFDARVKARAAEVAALAKKLATKAHRSKVTLADIRNAAKTVAAAHRNDLVRVAVTAVGGGVKLRAVRPVTHKPIALTVTVKAGKPVIKAA